MTLQTRPAIEKVTSLNRWPADYHLQRRESESLEEIRSILVDAAHDVAALIDGVCCRIGSWVDWQHYRPHPRMFDGGYGDPCLIIRLALAEDIFGLRYGGYIEVCVLSEEGIIEACGGYYDAYDQPKPVIDGSLRWHEVSHQSVGQALMLMHDRIIRAYIVREESDDRLCLGHQGGIQGDWQLVRQPAGQLQDTIIEEGVQR